MGTAFSSVEQHEDTGRKKQHTSSYVSEEDEALNLNHVSPKPSQSPYRLIVPHKLLRLSGS